MVIFIGIAISLLIAIWVFQDARKRYQKEKDLIAILWFFGVWGLLIVFLPLYLIARPRLPQEVKIVEKPKLCPNCGKYYEGNHSFCPNCGAKLKD